MLANGKIPDLWCEAGVVGEVKNLIGSGWGPKQLLSYMRQCDQQWPEYEWQGVLTQGEPELTPAASNAIGELPERYRSRITVWSVARTGKLGRPRAVQL